MKEQQEAKVDYKVKDRSAKVAKRRNPGMVVSNRSLKTVLIERAAKSQKQQQEAKR